MSALPLLRHCHCSLRFIAPTIASSRTPQMLTDSRLSSALGTPRRWPTRRLGGARSSFKRRKTETRTPSHFSKRIGISSSFKTIPLSPPSPQVSRAALVVWSVTIETDVVAWHAWHECEHRYYVPDTCRAIRLLRKSDRLVMLCLSLITLPCATQPRSGAPLNRILIVIIHTLQHVPSI